MHPTSTASKMACSQREDTFAVEELKTATFQLLPNHQLTLQTHLTHPNDTKAFGPECDCEYKSWTCLYAVTLMLLNNSPLFVRTLLDWHGVWTCAGAVSRTAVYKQGSEAT